MGRYEQYCFLAAHNLLFSFAAETAAQGQDLAPEIYAVFKSLSARVLTLGTLEAANRLRDNMCSNRLSCGD